MASWFRFRPCGDARTCCDGAAEETTGLLSGRRGRLLSAPQPAVPEVDASPAYRPETPASVIQFGSSLYYCTEDEGEVLVEVVRIGDRAGVASISYLTQDSSAKAGVKYELQEGILEFGPGECTKTLRVPIINDDSFDAALEFCIKLHDVRGARLAKYLNTCRVVIIDDDTFPTNRFSDLVHAKDYEQIPALKLMIEYTKMNLRSVSIRRATLKSLLLDQIKNLYYILTIYLQIYMIDIVLAADDPEVVEEEQKVMNEGTQNGRRLVSRYIRAAARFLSEGGETAEDEFEPFGGKLIFEDRKRTGIAVGIMYIAPFLLLQLIDIQKIRFGIAGKSRQSLQANLLRKFFNYGETVRTGISSAEVTMTMIRDVSEVVNQGFMKIIEIARIVGKVSMSCVFILAENRMAAFPLVVNPIIMVIFLCLREGITVRTNEAAAKKQNLVVQSMHDSVKNFRLLADFQLKPYVVDMFEETIIEYNVREVDSQIVSVNNSYLPQWLITILVGVYMMSGTVLVDTCGGTLSLGTFLATINIFKETGRELAEVYIEMAEVMKASGPLKKVTELMNLETDLEERMRVRRMRQQIWHKRREELTPDARLEAGTFAVDQVSIEMYDVTFAYQAGRPLLEQASGTFPQGGLYGIVGAPHQGKGTLLRLMGEVLLVEGGSGYMFVPPHLQILHVSHETCILENSSLYTNVVFNQDPSTFGGRARVKAIFRMLGFAKDFIARLDEEAEDEERPHQEGVEDWNAALSDTDLARLNLARAFVLNPEFMVLHKPILYFDENESSRIIQLLRRHVDERGLAVGQEKPVMRRPRTVVFTSPTMYGLQAADKLFEISNKQLHPVPEDAVRQSAATERRVGGEPFMKHRRQFN